MQKIGITGNGLEKGIEDITIKFFINVSEILF